MSIWLAAAMIATLAAPEAPAAPPPSGDAGTTVQGVVVTARPAPETDAIAAFVADVSAQTGNRRLARWDRKICPGVVGVRPAYAQMLIDRIARTAGDIGLEVGAPGCRANMIIVGTTDSPALVQSLVKESGRALGKYESGVTRGRKALDAFVTSEAPVRWWHVTAPISADGQKYDTGGTIRTRDAGRIRATTRDDFSHVVIVMDSRRMGRLDLTALADYIAMVGLAQIEPDADTEGVSTILNLFRDRDAGLTPPDALTAWDVAYLKGLYAARRDAPRGSAQERDMVRSMSRDLAAPPRPTDEADKD